MEEERIGNREMVCVIPTNYQTNSFFVGGRFLTLQYTTPTTLLCSFIMHYSHKTQTKEHVAFNIVVIYTRNGTSQYIVGFSHLVF